MDLVVLDEKETPCALRALRDVVASNGTITPAGRRFVEVIAELHGTTVDVGSLSSIAPGQVAEVISEPQRRKRVACSAHAELGTSRDADHMRRGTLARRAAACRRVRAVRRRRGVRVQLGLG
jgi:hypothetical protein